jgi:hypothetical protein
VNFPEVSLRSITIEEENHARVCVVHHNMAGALREFNNIFSEVDINVDKQFSDSRYVSLVPRLPILLPIIRVLTRAGEMSRI